MTSTPHKPRLVFFQFKYDNRLPSFLLTHKREHVDCLSRFFDVTVINEDCNYKKICDAYEPDLALFESGVNHTTCQRLRIDDVRSCAHVPKLGLHHADAFCNARAGFLSDMEHWGIDTFFAISTTAAEHTPEIADCVFTWPVFVDPTIYRDYGIWKSIPILFTGNRRSFYPWRNQLWQVVSDHYGTLDWPHPGYSAGTPAVRMLVGEQYARTLNSAWFVPACGTVAKDIVRKHFEVPGSRSCLVTEGSAALEAAGFVDMQNCVFADAHDVLDKLDYLFRNRDVLTAITDAGHHLVHSRHTLQHRDQIYQWFCLRKNLRPHETIVQPGPFERLTVMTRSSGAKSSHVISGGLHLELLLRGDMHFRQGAYDDAESCYRKCSVYMPWMPEPKLRLALCRLYKGDAASALSLIEKQLTFVLHQYGAQDPDPVEWASYLVALLCAGKRGAARRCAEAYPTLRHPYLDVARRAVTLLNKRKDDVLPFAEADGRHRLSIHQLPVQATEDWVVSICTMMRNCKQSAMSSAFEAADFEWSRPANSENVISEKSCGRRTFGRRLVESRFMLHALRARLAAVVHGMTRGLLHRLEARVGYFLPYRLSTSKRDELFRLLWDRARSGDVTAILVLGSALKSRSIDAVLAGAAENGRRPSVCCLGVSLGRRVQRAIERYPTTKWHRLPASQSSKLLESIESIKKEQKSTCFDLVLITECDLETQVVAKAVLGEHLLDSVTVVIEGLNSAASFAIYETLLNASHFELATQNPSLRDGYAVFTKVANPVSERRDETCQILQSLC